MSHTLHVLWGGSFENIYNNPSLEKIASDIKDSDPFRIVHYPGGQPGSVGSNIAMGFGLESAGGFSTMIPKKYLDLWKYKDYLHFLILILFL